MVAKSLCTYSGPAIVDDVIAWLVLQLICVTCFFGDWFRTFKVVCQYIPNIQS